MPERNFAKPDVIPKPVLAAPYPADVSCATASVATRSAASSTMLERSNFRRSRFIDSSRFKNDTIARQQQEGFRVRSRSRRTDRIIVSQRCRGGDVVNPPLAGCGKKQILVRRENRLRRLC